MYSCNDSEQRYEKYVAQTKQGSLCIPDPAYYQEIRYVNYSSSAVVVTDMFGKQTTILGKKKNYDPAGRRVEILARTITNESQVLYVGTSRDDIVNCSRLLLSISFDELERGPIYIRETNEVICLEQDAGNVRHPYRQLEFEDKKKLFREAILSEVKQQSCCQFIVNDPLKIIRDNVYGDIGGDPTPLTVTHDINRGDKITLTVFYKNRDTVYTKDYDLSALEKDEYVILTKCPIKVIGLTPGLVKKHLDDQLYSEKDLTDEIKRVRLQCERESSDEIENLKATNKSLNTKIDLLKDKNTTLENQLATITGGIKGAQTVEEYNYQNSRSREKQHKDTLDTTLEYVKTGVTLISAVVSIALLIDKLRK